MATVKGNMGVVSVRRTVVVIEDDQDMRGLIEGILTGGGLDVHVADTGAAGVESVLKNDPDVVVMDFGLPDFSGVEATRRIRDFNHVPVLMLTGHQDVTDTAFAAGVTAVMAKPFRPPELRKRVETLLAHHNHTTVTREADSPPLSSHQKPSTIPNPAGASQFGNCSSTSTAPWLLVTLPARPGAVADRNETIAVAVIGGDVGGEVRQ